MHSKRLLFLSAASALLSKATALPVQAEVAMLPFENTHDVANGTLVLNKRVNLQDVEIGCNRNVQPLCHKRMGIFDADVQVAQTCPRRALAAKASFLDFCRGQEMKGEKAVNAKFCKGAMPTIQLCCSEWLHDDAFSMWWPTARDYNTGLVEPKMTGAEIAHKRAINYQFGAELVGDTQILKDHLDWVFRKVIKPEAWQFNDRVTDCLMWGPITEAQFQYWYQTFLENGIDEAKETKESNEPREMVPNDS